MVCRLLCPVQRDRLHHHNWCAFRPRSPSFSPQVSFGSRIGAVSPEVSVASRALASAPCRLLNCLGMGALYNGDNLDIFRWYVKDEMVDLVCLDPSFNTAARRT